MSVKTSVCPLPSPTFRHSTVECRLPNWVDSNRSFGVNRIEIIFGELECTSWYGLIYRHYSCRRNVTSRPLQMSDVNYVCPFQKFFRRGLVESPTYSCKFTGNCVINPRTRNLCRYCRYQKCRESGMSRGGRNEYCWSLFCAYIENLSSCHCKIFENLRI